MGQYVSNIERTADILLLDQIAQASKRISRDAQWIIFRVALIISDIFMIAMAFGACRVGHARKRR